MKTERHAAPVGNGKQIVFEADPDNVHEQEMGRLFDIVAATKPHSLQEFFIRLAAMQKSGQASDTVAS
jgi:hypothetical protein